ncbi:integration host factor subunit alpha [Acidithiobacillus ferrooxidans]|uniref:integration host factor subunit alpha n=1 Tax=Acidithiobacillus ferrooxidans TaxID=920 RepID=UPI000A665F2E|nr:integration host factor subunit alpha [Acidithiobacillus ferrooxidans]
MTSATLQKSGGLHPAQELYPATGPVFVLEDPATPRRTVTKQDLTDHLVSSMRLSGKESKALVELFFDTMRSTLAAGEDVKLSGFGNFTLREKRARPGRNPRTAEMVQISARRVVTFRASQKLREACLAGVEKHG